MAHQKPSYILLFAFLLSIGSTFLSAKVAESSQRASLHINSVGIGTPDPFYCDSYGHCHYYGPEKPPKTILGNTAVAVMGGTMTCMGALFATIGIFLIKQALFNNETYENAPEIQRILDGFGGSLFSSFGIVFALIGADTIKKSLSRLYKLWHNLPLPEDEIKKS
ncbi:hypothetical protein KC460_02070 [Candidatus Dependentiae bacterium]|nr:hypothetical protein [Candidatus Dependentiae bacterium]